MQNETMSISCLWIGQKALNEKSAEEALTFFLLSNHRSSKDACLVNIWFSADERRTSIPRDAL